MLCSTSECLQPSPGGPGPPHTRRVLVIVPVNGVTRLTSYVISEALSVGDGVTALAVTFCDETERETQPERALAEWDSGVRLMTLHSHYHSVAPPIVRFTNAFEHPGHGYEHIIVLIPVIQPDRWYQRILLQPAGPVPLRCASGPARAGARPGSGASA